MTLAQSLIELSSSVQTAYSLALDTHRDDVAAELRLLADKVSGLIVRTLRAEIEEAPKVVVDVDSIRSAGL